MVGSSQVSAVADDRRSIGVIPAHSCVFITHFDVAEIVQGSEGIGLTISLQAGGAWARVRSEDSGARMSVELVPGCRVSRCADTRPLLRMNRLDKTIVARSMA